MAHKQKLVVVGGGAAGFFCAVNAAAFYPELEIHLLEKSGKFLSKVAVSGGGRCNVTQACSSISEMIKAYPRGSRFLKKAFYQFFTSDTIDWFQQRGVSLKVENDGRVFPTTDNSTTIVDCLLQNAQKAGVLLQLHSAVKSIRKTEKAFSLILQDGKTLLADFVCIASGGSPKLEQFDWLADLHLDIIPPFPSLFTFNLPGHPIRKLMGISVPEVEIQLAGTKLKSEGPVLITHWGLSGPAVLRLSAMAARVLATMNYKFTIRINWLPEYNEESLRAFVVNIRKTKAGSSVSARNPFGLPGRLWKYFLEQAAIDEAINWADLPTKQQNLLIKILCTHEISVSGKTTFKEEFVTAGGISLDEMDVQTMMCKKHPGLFFAGEILDIDGITGGYNFQNAWTTGYIAAKHITNQFGN